MQAGPRESRFKSILDVNTMAKVLDMILVSSRAKCPLWFRVQFHILLREWAHFLSLLPTYIDITSCTDFGATFTPGLEIWQPIMRLLIRFPRSGPALVVVMARLTVNELSRGNAHFSMRQKLGRMQDSALLRKTIRTWGLANLLRIRQWQTKDMQMAQRGEHRSEHSNVFVDFGRERRYGNSAPIQCNAYHPQYSRHIVDLP